MHFVHTEMRRIRANYLFLYLYSFHYTQYYEELCQLNSVQAVLGKMNNIIKNRSLEVSEQ